MKVKGRREGALDGWMRRERIRVPASLVATQNKTIEAERECSRGGAVPGAAVLLAQFVCSDVSVALFVVYSDGSFNVSR